ncbi:MAG: DUF1810 domain-containing protein [Fimbriiglobus sp.]
MSPDPFDLQRFVLAQEESYEQALNEVRAGSKHSHWIWYIFPQFRGLGFSEMSQKYAIQSLAEAHAYLQHPELGSRLLEICEATLAVEGRSALTIFGSPDDMKVRSCTTLFAHITPSDSVFEQLLAKYFDGNPDSKTLALILGG